MLNLILVSVWMNVVNGLLLDLLILVFMLLILMVVVMLVVLLLLLVVFICCFICFKGCIGVRYFLVNVFYIFLGEILLFLFVVFFVIFWIIWENLICSCCGRERLWLVFMMQVMLFLLDCELIWIIVLQVCLILCGLMGRYGICYSMLLMLQLVVFVFSFIVFRFLLMVFWWLLENVVYIRLLLQG